MYPTLFKIPFLPEGWADIKSYGAMMTVAFLGGIWLACRRALRVRADPDVVINMGFIALIAGVVGARAFFVIHYWNDRFANQPHPWWDALSIRAGGLEFWGGPLLVIPSLIVYLLVRRHSIRWYLDVTAPSLMFGMAMARIGCFLNGCCWGSICIDEHDPARMARGLPWAVRYPYGSPAMSQQFDFGQLELPKELQCYLPTGQVLPVPHDYLELSREEIDGPARDVRQAEEQLETLRRSGADEKALQAQSEQLKKLRQLADARQKAFNYYVDQNCKQYGLSVSELRDLSRHYPSRPTHPAPLYATVTGLILYWVLDWMVYWRKRHGVVLGSMLILYSVARIFEEAIRQDNPLDALGLSWSTVVSLTMIAVGLLWLVIMRALPEKSPHAAPFYGLPEHDAPDGAEATAT
ncbi:MAG: prolipoprotein diacylglyceryl transferase family protein [Phycisphaerae bacterium]